tara:strand:- start:26354 stop:28954 length:2601 start_codon:yes stop_codon:yes gene_type:complete
MKNIYENIFVLIATLFILFILFNKFMFGEFVFMSGDSLAPQAVKQSIYNIKNQTGLFPYWFPFIFSGMPTVHSLLNTNEYYFPHLFINYLYDLGMPWFWNFIFHYLFASIGMYKFLRYLKQSKIIALIFSILFTISPYMIAYLVHGHGSQIMTASYIPWIMLFLFKLHSKKNIINFSFFALLIGFQLLRGHVQIVYYTWIMIGFYLLINSIFYYRENKEIKKYFYNNSIILLSLFLGFLTSLKIYFPILNYSKFSTRGAEGGGFGIEQATQWSLNFKESLTFILPYAYGFGGKDYWGFLPMTDFPNYIGIIILFLAILGLIKSDIKKENKVFFLVLIIFSFLLSLGKNFMFFYNIFYSYLPYFSKFRVPIFILIVMQFCIYVLAACGLSKFVQLIKNKIYNKRIIYGLVISTILIFLNSLANPDLYQPDRYGIKKEKKDQIFTSIKDQYLYMIGNSDLNQDSKYNEIDKNLFEVWTDSEFKLLNSQLIFQETNQTKEELILILTSINESEKKLIKQFKRDNYFIIFILLLIFVLTILYSRQYIRIKDWHYIFIIGFLLIFDYVRVDLEIINSKNHLPNNNIIKKNIELKNYLKSDEVVDYLSRDKTKFRLLDLTNLDNMNRWSAFNLESVNGYHPAKLNSYNKMLGLINQKGGAYPYGLLQALNIKYILHTQKGLIPNFNLINEPFQYFANNIQNQDYIDTYIYENQNPLERIFIIDNIELTSNNDIIIDKITDPAFDPVNLSYINENNLTSNQINQLKNIDKNTNSSIDLISWSTDEIIFKTDFNKPQLVCFSEIFYPGWFIDDEDINIIKINGLFRGLILPAGKRNYTMYYKPFDLRISLFISRISYLIIIILLLYNWYRRKNV